MVYHFINIFIIFIIVIIFAKLVEEDDVKSDRLRIILNTSSHIVTETGVVVAVKPRVESTGSTVINSV